jgi:hypothetical protein
MTDAAFLAEFEQLTEQAIDETCEVAAEFDALDETTAILALQRRILEAEEMGRNELAMAIAALAVRMHRRGGGR